MLIGEEEIILSPLFLFPSDLKVCQDALIQSERNPRIKFFDIVHSYPALFDLKSIILLSQNCVWFQLDSSTILCRVYQVLVLDLNRLFLQQIARPFEKLLNLTILFKHQDYLN